MRAGGTRSGGLHQRGHCDGVPREQAFISHTLEAARSEIEVRADLGGGGSETPSSLGPHVAEISSLTSPYKGTNPIRRAPPL